MVKMMEMVLSAASIKAEKIEIIVKNKPNS